MSEQDAFKDGREQGQRDYGPLMIALIASLRSCHCPSAWSGQRVGDCMDEGLCTCEHGITVRDAKRWMAARAVEAD
jgi:hypothetical protein